MKIDVRDLLYSVPAIKALGTRVGLPDDTILVEIAQPDHFAASLDALMRAFRELRPGSQTLVNANVYEKEIWVRILQNDRLGMDRDGRVEESLAPSLDALRAVAERSRGEVHYWGGNNYFDVSLPCPITHRAALLELNHLPWDERYRILLERESWMSLRDRVFRFSNLAATLANRCFDCGMTTVLIPSVGICVHPWIFASRGLTVTATDCAGTALAPLSQPDRHPNLYSSAAYEQWDASTCASYAMIPHPFHFDGMPALEDDHVREMLGRRITFVVEDWARLSLPAGSIDLVFAANAIPRDSDTVREAVLEEWVRVLRAGGVVYIAQHHAGGDWELEDFFRERGFIERNFTRGERPLDGERGSFQIRYSSG